MEADLGIDTVKQGSWPSAAVWFGLDENFRLRDYPTIEALAGWLSERLLRKEIHPTEGTVSAPVAVKKEEALLPASGAPVEGTRNGPPSRKCIHRSYVSGKLPGSEACVGLASPDRDGSY